MERIYATGVLGRKRDMWYESAVVPVMSLVLARSGAEAGGRWCDSERSRVGGMDSGVELVAAVIVELCLCDMLRWDGKRRRAVSGGGRSRVSCRETSSGRDAGKGGGWWAVAFPGSERSMTRILSVQWVLSTSCECARAGCIAMRESGRPCTAGQGSVRGREVAGTRHWDNAKAGMVCGDTAACGLDIVRVGCSRTPSRVSRSAVGAGSAGARDSSGGWDASSSIASVALPSSCCPAWSSARECRCICSERGLAVSAASSATRSQRSCARSGSRAESSSRMA